LKKLVKNFNSKKLILLISFLSLFILIFFVCKSNQVIEEQTFVNLYSDLLVTKELYRGNDSQYFKARDSLYKLYKVNNLMVEQTLRFYNSDVEKWNKFFQKVIKRLETYPAIINLPE